MPMCVATNLVEDVLDQYQRDLGAHYPRGEVRAIACAVFNDRLGWDAAEVMVNRDRALSESELLAVYLPLKRLRSGEPLQYVLGHTEFMGLRIDVGPAVLIPRPETEEMVDLIVRSTPVAPAAALDLGTGSGCIALALKKRYPSAAVTGIDVSEAALAVAAANGLRNGLHVEWRRMDVLDEGCRLPAADLVVSNPPYVPRSESGTLAPHVREHEPHLALFVDDADPIQYYRRIADHALRVLPSGGALWFEGHHLHAPAVGTDLRQRGFRDVQVIMDLSGAPRFIHARR